MHKYQNKYQIITMSKIENFIGMTIDKEKSLHICIGIEKYTKKNGDIIDMLSWESTSKKHGLVFKQITVPKLFISSLKNHELDKNPNLVEKGKRMYKEKKGMFSNFKTGKNDYSVD